MGRPRLELGTFGLQPSAFPIKLTTQEGYEVGIEPTPIVPQTIMLTNTPLTPWLGRGDSNPCPLVQSQR